MKLSRLIVIVGLVQLTLTNASYKKTIQKCLLAGIRGESQFPLFAKFIRRFRKSYDAASECSHRFKRFKISQEKAHKWQKMDKGTANYGVTFFSDLHPREIEQYLGYFKPNIKFKLARRIRQQKLPSSWDWRQKQAVNDPIYQGDCGSCYAFAVIGNLEGQYAAKYRKLYRFSEQQIIDCDREDFGCEGGLLVNASNYLMQSGAMLAQDYPYIGSDQRCGYQPNKVIVRPRSYESISESERQIARYIYNHGPIAAAVHANGPLSLYTSGILDVPCSTDLDHGVVIVGFGEGQSRSGSKKPYWIVKNSWGKDWGENGFFRIVRNKGKCGINLDAFSIKL